MKCICNLQRCVFCDQTTPFEKLESEEIIERIPEVEKVNHPQHYNVGKIEVIDIIEDWKLDFHLGNAIKYILRAKYKGTEIEDLKKAKWYLDRYIEMKERR